MFLCCLRYDGSEEMSAVEADEDIQVVFSDTDSQKNKKLSTKLGKQKSQLITNILLPIRLEIACTQLSFQRVYAPTIPDLGW